MLDSGDRGDIVADIYPRVIPETLSVDLVLMITVAFVLVEPEAFGAGFLRSLAINTFVEDVALLRILEVSILFGADEICPRPFRLPEGDGILVNRDR